MGWIEFGFETALSIGELSAAVATLVFAPANLVSFASELATAAWVTAAF